MIDNRLFSELISSPPGTAGLSRYLFVMTGQRNVYVNAIGQEHDDLNRISTKLNQLGLTIVDEQLIREEYVCPYHGFLDDAKDLDVVDDESTTPPYFAHPDGLAR